jgi:hypothetical protein
MAEVPVLQEQKPARRATVQPAGSSGASSVIVCGGKGSPSSVTGPSTTYTARSLARGSGRSAAWAKVAGPPGCNWRAASIMAAELSTPQ